MRGRFNADDKLKDSSVKDSSVMASGWPDTCSLRLNLTDIATM